MFTHEVPLKTRLLVAASVVAVGWTATAVYIVHGVKKMKADNAREFEVIDSARKVIMTKAAQGEYDSSVGFDSERFLSDYEFYKIAARNEIISK